MADHVEFIPESWIYKSAQRTFQAPSWKARPSFNSHSSSQPKWGENFLLFPKVANLKVAIYQLVIFLCSQSLNPLDFSAQPQFDARKFLRRYCLGFDFPQMCKSDRFHKKDSEILPYLEFRPIWPMLGEEGSRWGILSLSSFSWEQFFLTCMHYFFSQFREETSTQFLQDQFNS